MPDRYADTKIDASGRRVPASDVEEAAGPSRLSVSQVDPDTQIAADGTRVPADLAGDVAAPRNAESLFREQRAAETAGATNPPVPGPGISADVERTKSGDDAADGDPEDAGDEPDLASKTKDELLEMAADLEIDGRSSMNKAELIEAVRAAQ